MAQLCWFAVKVSYRVLLSLALAKGITVRLQTCGIKLWRSACACLCVCVCMWCVCACVCFCVYKCMSCVHVCLCVHKDFWRKLNHTGYLRKKNLNPRTDVARSTAEWAVQIGTLRPIGEFCGLGGEVVKFWLCRYLALHWLLTVRSTVVTICTASLTFNNSTFCPQSVFMCFV